MKTIAIIMALFLATGLSAQENNIKKEAAKKEQKERKEKREAALAEQFNETSAILNSMRFVLEADYLSNQYGYRSMANSNLNFILVDSTEAVIQTGNNVGIGYNGVGGITAKGNITRWVVNKNDKRKTMSVEMNVSTSIGFFQVFMDISVSGKTTATLSSNWAGKLIYDGRLVPLDDSYAFKGSSL